MNPRKKTEDSRSRSAYDRALRLLARREQSGHELAQSLSKRGHDSEEISVALARLREDGYQSDRRFAEMLARTRISQGYGPQRIRAELRSHALDDDLTSELCANADADWTASARAQLHRRYGDKPAMEFAERARRAQFLLRRGFDAATVSVVTRAEIDGAEDVGD